MVAFAVTALSSLAEGLGLTSAATVGTGVAGQAVGASAIGGVTAASGGSWLTTILQGGATALGALGTIRAANTKADAYNLQAKDAEFDATSEAIAGTKRQTQLRRSLLKTLGERDVAYAAGNIDLTFGTPQAAREGAVDETNAAITRDQSQTETRMARLRERAANLRRLAQDARSSGPIGVLGDLVDFGSSVARRG